MENINEQICEIVKRGRGRPKKIVDPNDADDLQPKKLGRPIAPWRHGEDGKYNSHAIDPEYAIKFWRANYRKPHTCTICGRTLQCSGAIPKHERTMYCQLAKFLKEKQN